MAVTSGSTSRFPKAIDAFYIQENAKRDTKTGAITGDIVRSALKNQMSDALVMVQQELKSCARSAGSKDVLVAAATAVLIDVQLASTPASYTLYLPEDTARFLGCDKIGYRRGGVSAQLTSVRPYYSLYPAATQASLKNLWSTLSSRSYFLAPQMFTVVTGSAVTDAAPTVTFTFDPGDDVTSEDIFTSTYNAYAGEHGTPNSCGVGAFIASIIFFSESDN